MTNQPETTSKVTSLNCLVGSLISGFLAFLLYQLTQSIAQSFAQKPITVSQPWAIQLATAVRTLVVGMSSLATGLFALSTVGLILLAGQLIFQKMRSSPNIEE